jgi:hypothetical protein
MNNQIDVMIDSGCCEAFTGCQDASGFREYAEKNGYSRIEVLDWTSSAGNWCFIVSKDGETWQQMTQTNDYPRSGFTRCIDDVVFEGAVNEALEYFGSN